MRRGAAGVAIVAFLMMGCSFFEVNPVETKHSGDLVETNHFTEDEILSIEKRIRNLRKGMSPIEVSNMLGIDLVKINYKARGHNPRSYLYPLWTYKGVDNKRKHTHTLVISYSYDEDGSKAFLERARMHRLVPTPSSSGAPVGDKE